jgi:hypothetical protein
VCLLYPLYRLASPPLPCAQAIPPLSIGILHKKHLTSTALPSLPAQLLAKAGSKRASCSRQQAHLRINMSPRPAPIRHLTSLVALLAAAVARPNASLPESAGGSFTTTHASVFRTQNPSEYLFAAASCPCTAATRHPLAAAARQRRAASRCGRCGRWQAFCGIFW